MKIKFLIFLLLGGFYTNAQTTAVDELMADLERSKSLTLAYVKAMPEDQFNYKPNDSVKTYSEQVLHMTQATIGLASNATGAERLYADQNLEKDASLHNKEDVSRLISEAYDFAMAQLKTLNESNAHEMTKMGNFESSRIGWIRKAEEHNVHHRGSLAIYLRSLNLAPPGYQLF